MKMKGTAYKLEGRIAATDLLPAQYDRLAMRREWNECANHVLEGYRGATGARPSAGDILIGGDGLGSGHAHYHMGALMACREAGVLGMIGIGVDGMFQRAAIDMGYLTWGLPELVAFVTHGDSVEIDLAQGHAINRSQGKEMSFSPLPGMILDILQSGGAFNWSLGRANRLISA